MKTWRWREEDKDLYGRAAVQEWRKQEARCACGAPGDEKHGVSGTSGFASARWLGCPYCGTAVGRPLIKKREED